MKRIIMIILGVAGFSGAAMAQERQVYSPYPAPVFTQQQAEQIEDQVDMQRVGTRRVYPGRELYGTNFGPMPRHPGDYRDAVDRGAWTGGGSAVGSRSFSIE